MPENLQSIAPANSVIIPTLDVTFTPTRGISFGTAGALSIITAENEAVVIPSGALASGIMHAISLKRINSSGTTATNIIVYR